MIENKSRQPKTKFLCRNYYFDTGSGWKIRLPPNGRPSGFANFIHIFWRIWAMVAFMEFRRRMMWSRCSDGRRLTEGTHSTETAIDLLSCGIRNTGWQMEGCHSNNHGWLIFGFCLCCRECSGSGDWPDDTLTDIPTRHSPTFADIRRHTETQNVCMKCKYKSTGAI